MAPLTVTVKVSPAATVAVPVITGVVSLVVLLATKGVAGAVVSTTSSPEVESLVALPAASVTVAVTA